MGSESEGKRNGTLESQRRNVLSGAWAGCGLSLQVTDHFSCCWDVWSEYLTTARACVSVCKACKAVIYIFRWYVLCCVKAVCDRIYAFRCVYTCVKVPCCIC